MRKYKLFLLAILFVFGLFAFSTNSVSALVPGCSSTFGFSATNGASCGESRPSQPLYPSGCNSYSGYSATTGNACDGRAQTSESIYMPGCTSYRGYSVTDGLPCSGQDDPILDVPAEGDCITSAGQDCSIEVYSSPGFPSTGDCTITSTLRLGSTGGEVACLQRRLGLLVDGKFGPKTEAAAIFFQSTAGLKADGVVGPLSLRALDY